MIEGMVAKCVALPDGPDQRSLSARDIRTHHEQNRPVAARFQRFKQMVRRIRRSIVNDEGHFAREPRHF